MKREIENAARAISMMIPLTHDWEIKNGALTEWTPKGLETTKWPKSFSARERKFIRTIARAAIEAAHLEQRPSAEGSSGTDGRE